MSDDLKRKFRKQYRYDMKLKEGGKAWERAMTELEKIKKQIEINESYKR